MSIRDHHFCSSSGSGIYLGGVLGTHKALAPGSMTAVHTAAPKVLQIPEVQITACYLLQEPKRPYQTFVFWSMT